MWRLLDRSPAPHGAWVKEQHVRVDKGKIAGYQVNMMVTFVLDDDGDMA